MAHAAEMVAPHPGAGNGETPSPASGKGREEKAALAEAVEAARADTAAALQRRDYVSVLTRLAALRPQVDAFFDAVMVNAEDPDLRRNRLALLRRLADRLGSVAAIEHLSA